jgi:ABC-type multidrug transport system fused ATPase/permease subunit
MFASFRRGWAMAKASWAVLKDQPSLAVFPVISVVAAAALSAALVVPVALGGITAVGLGLPDKALQALGYVAFFAWYFVCTFAFVFCNAALVSCAMQRFTGQQATVGSGFAAARRRLRQILGWSLLAATVGVILRGLQSVLKGKAGFAGELVAGLAEGVWGVATYFAIPVVVTEGLGPIDALKRSSSILRRTWGESLSGSAGLSIIMGLFLLPIIGVAALMGTALGGSPVVVALAVLCGLYLVVLTVVFAALGSIFRAGVYTYATTGTVPAHMDAELLQATFRSASTG